MLHLKSYPHDRETTDANTELDQDHTYPCLATNHCCCDSISLVLSFFFHPRQTFSCSFIQQGLCFEIRGCLKPGTVHYPCDCNIDGGGYLCQLSFFCGQFGCSCCHSDQMYLSRYQCCCLSCENVCCRSIIPNEETYWIVCFHSNSAIDDIHSRCCLNLTSIRQLH
jgi:hypothetical protein